MENMPLKNQSDVDAMTLAIELAAKQAENQKNSMQAASDLAQSVIDKARLEKPKDPSSKASSEFKQEFEQCEAHGEYPLNVLCKDGHARRLPQGCPTCLRQKNAMRLLAESNIPKRFADCDFDNYEATTKEQRHVLSRCEKYANEFAKYRDDGACLLLCGRVGTGKNHLATAISKRLLGDGYSVLRVKASQYLDAYWAKSFDERESWLKSMAAVDLLMIDEIGRSSSAKAAQDAFFRIFDARYEAQLPSLIATNLNRDELIEVLGDATYDRLTQGGSIRLTFDWVSKRSEKAVAA
jgi:DNA replication protein DnaC